MAEKLSGFPSESERWITKRKIICLCLVIELLQISSLQVHREVNNHHSHYFTGEIEQETKDLEDLKDWTIDVFTDALARAEESVRNSR
ncbi:hypothetical protein CDL15_Pgr018931 [Punica granatum]|uniref:Uncharacterized protein n=1 Tax=Punica granatum TaxID=22663 RepID=A0A218WNQ8_PUNGR|nr:hypothetical protein CDL15_Pgr018931 [Punica granatum]